MTTEVEEVIRRRHGPYVEHLLPEALDQTPLELGRGRRLRCGRRGDDGAGQRVVVDLPGRAEGKLVEGNPHGRRFRRGEPGLHERADVLDRGVVRQDDVRNEPEVIRPEASRLDRRATDAPVRE